MGRAVPILLALMILPCAWLAHMGLDGLREDAERAALRYREQAEIALRAVEAALSAEIARLRDEVEEADDRIRFVATADGALVLSDAASRRSTTPGAAAQSPLVRALESDVARIERASGDAAAAVRLRDVASRVAERDVRAWALTALGAVERRAGRLEEARAAWRTLADEHADAADSAGLRRAHVARLLLAESGPSEDAADALIRLYDDVTSEADAPRSAAAAVFRAQVAAAARAALGDDAASDAARRGMEIAARRDARLALELRFETAWREGAADWVAAGADAGARAFTADGGAPLIVAVRPAEDGRLWGAAADVSSLVRAAFRTPEVRSFTALGLTPAFDVDEDALARSALGAPWPAGASIGVFGADLAGFREAARRRLLSTAGLAAAAAVAALIAALATMRAVRREAAAARGREAFVAATTHELKTPLAAIKLLAELLLEPALAGPKRIEFAGRIGLETDRLARLVSAVLDYAKLEQDGTGVRARFKPEDLASLATEAVETLRPVAAVRGFEIVVRTPATPLPVLGDGDALRGALLNLLDNAMKYSEPPQAIETEAWEPSKGLVAFAVSDRGRGVPASERTRIFEPFSRIGDELTRDRPGAGLGLALVAKVAAAHGGSARVEPREGGGSRFVVELPRLGAETSS